jgi:hypothetical protein
MQEFEGEKYLDIIKTRRMEINAIMNVVGGEIFSKWLRKKLVEEFHNRFYHPRSIFIDNFVLTPTMIEFNKRVDKFATVQLKNLVEASREKLVNVKGHVIDVSKKETKIKNAMISQLMDNTKTLYLESALRDFMDQHLPT